MSNRISKIEREKRTVSAMISLYCQGKKHTSSSSILCPQCAELERYAHARLEHCRFGNAKPSCTRCPLHCYKPIMRQRIREVMRYSGPRMLLHNPIMAIAHLWDFLRAKLSQR